MIERRLIFLGPCDPPSGLDPDPADIEELSATAPSASPFRRPSFSPPREDGALIGEGRILVRGDSLVLQRIRSPWSFDRPVERIIAGTHPHRADLLLDGAGLAAEHARFYLSREEAGTNDLKAIWPDTVRVNGEAVGHEWRSLACGDEIDLGPWRFRFEI